MTREDRLYAMTGATLIQVADKLGVKVSCNKTRTALKEAKANVIERIIAAENAAEEAETAEIMQAKVDAGVEIMEINPEEVQIVDKLNETVVNDSESEEQKSVSSTTIDYTITILEMLNLTYKRSRDGVAVLDSNGKKRLDMWKRKNKIRMYLNSSEDGFASLDKNLVLNITNTIGAVANRFDTSLYIPVENIETVIRQLVEVG